MHVENPSWAVFHTPSAGVGWTCMIARSITETTALIQTAAFLLA